MESIMQSVKKLLGVMPEYTVFDTDILIHINTVFSILTQLGVGPSEGFSITGEETIWKDFLPNEDPRLEAVKSYMYLKVRLLFDPPLSSAVKESIDRQISELEWRLNVAAED